MMITERSVVVGVFQEDAQAEQAVHGLQLAGFRDDQIRFSVRGDARNIFDGLTQMGVSQAEAEYYNQEFTAGKTVVVVLTNDRQQEASRILQQNHAYDAHIIHERTGDQTIQVREERLNIEKRWVAAGEVRIRKRVVTENKTFVIPISREEIIIERYPAQDVRSDVREDSSGTDTGVNEQMAGTTEIEGAISPMEVGESRTFFLREEQVRFEKVPMLVEQVIITKRIVEDIRTIQETVRKEEVEVDTVGNVRMQKQSEGNTSDTY